MFSFKSASRPLHLNNTRFFNFFLLLMIRLYAECTAKLTPEYNKHLKKTIGDSYSYIYIFSIHLAMTTIRQLQMLSEMSSVFL